VKKTTLDICAIIISIASALIALASTVSTCILTLDAHRQNAIANDASLGFDIDTDEGSNKLGMTLRNVGPGKVHINAVSYYVDGKPVSGIEDAIIAAKLSSALLLPFDLEDDWMGPGEATPIFKYTALKSQQDDAATFVEEHVAVAVNYCTIGNRCEIKCSERGRCGARKN